MDKEGQPTQNWQNNKCLYNTILWVSSTIKLLNGFTPAFAVHGALAAASPIAQSSLSCRRYLLLNKHLAAAVGPPPLCRPDCLACRIHRAGRSSQFRALDNQDRSKRIEQDHRGPNREIVQSCSPSGAAPLALLVGLPTATNARCSFGGHAVKLTVAPQDWANPSAARSESRARQTALLPGRAALAIGLVALSAGLRSQSQQNTS